MRWDHITVLTLQADSMFQAAVIALVKATLPSLSVLCLDRVPLQPEHAWHLADNFAGRLRGLELCSMRLNASCLAKITQNHSMTWPLLETLKVDGCTLDRPCMEQLLPVLYFKLRILALSFCNITHNTIAAFTGANWSLLRTLCLSGNSLAMKDVHRLSQANLPVLRQLYWASTQMSALCVAHLINGHWPLLQTLNLDNNTLDEQAMRHMQDKPVHLCWQAMINLHLSNYFPLYCITCLTYLHCSQLQTLHLANVGLSAAGFLSLRNACWPILEVLNVTNNDLIPNYL